MCGFDISLFLTAAAALGPRLSSSTLGPSSVSFQSAVSSSCQANGNNVCYTDLETYVNKNGFTSDSSLSASYPSGNDCSGVVGNLGNMCRLAGLPWGQGER